MPAPNLPTLGDNPSLQQIVDYIVKLQRDQEWLLANLDDMNVRRLRADVIVAGTLDTGKVTIRSDLTSGFIQIDGSGMRINNGSYDTFAADMLGRVTMTSALIQSRPGSYPRVVMDPSSDLFGAYQSVSNYAVLQPVNSTTGAPALSIFQGGSRLAIGFGVGLVSDRGIVSDAEFEIRAPAGIHLSGITNVTNWSNIRKLASPQLTLQQELDSKANAFSGITGTLYVATSSGGEATWPIEFENGIAT